MEQGSREILTIRHERAILVALLLPGYAADPHDPLGELAALANTAGAVVVDQLLQKKRRPEAGTFIGSGKVRQLAEMVDTQEVDAIIFDNDLSPSQISNIEKVVECKVLDRSELILDIFAVRARTHEAKLQVELAQLEYTYPRLTAMWSHLERIVGGSPTGIGTRGPGEQQLETDRRIVQRRKAELKREIIRLQGRKMHEVAKRNRDFFTVGLVGYTNAGKSTLFNTATQASGGGGAYTNDKLFATLSTRTRRWDVDGGDSVMLSDTVGFVRDLPHQLVASFKATLEEAVHSDLLLIVLDVSHPRARHQLEVVNHVLDELGAIGQQRRLVLNKTDLLEHNADLLVLTKEHPDAIPISAMNGSGMDQLIETVRAMAHGDLCKLRLAVPIADGKSLHFIENRAEVLNRDYRNRQVIFTVRIGDRQLNQLLATNRSIRLLDEDESNSADEPTAGWVR